MKLFVSALRTRRTKEIPTERLATKCVTSLEPHARGEANKGANAHFAHINTTEDGRSSTSTWRILLSWHGHTNSSYYHGSVAGRTSLEPHVRLGVDEGASAHFSPVHTPKDGLSSIFTWHIS